MKRSCFVILLSLALAGLAAPVASEAQVICTGNSSPPPELPVYEQPPIPEPGYIWVPGDWGIGASGYFWVPGTWVLPPAVGLLWTPGYWGWRDGIYVWNAGYWGPHIGFYGGINYGFGYSGVGYEGGRWENGVFAYNRTVNNFGGVRITNVYEKTIVVQPGAVRVSFNGGTGGTTVRPTPAEEAAVAEKHVAALPSQLQQEHTASENKALLASENHGKPAIAATAKPGEFAGKGVVAAREATPVTSPAIKPTGAAIASPSASEPKALEKQDKAGKSEATLPGGTPKPTEAKLPTGKSEATPQRAMPLKPINNGAKPVNTEAKLPTGKPQPLNNQLKPQTTAAPPKTSNPPTQAANGSNPHPNPNPPHPTAGAPHPQPSPKDKDKKPPPG
jgi:hypothetical protein